jgi:hypothetical protein
MRNIILSTAALVLGMTATLMAAPGSYGTIDLGYLGRPGPSMGNGGRFDYDIANESNLNLPEGWDFKRFDSPSALAGGQDGQDDLYTFCVETSQFVPGNSTPHTYTVDPAVVALDKLGDYYWTLAVTPGNNTQAGAFQLAAWEIVLGNGDLNITTSPVISGSYSNDAKNLAQSWLNSLAALSDNPLLQMVVLANGSFQNQITQIVAVPEATTLIVWSFIGGSIGLAVYRRGGVFAAAKADC